MKLIKQLNKEINMTRDELDDLQIKVDRAEKLQTKIDKIDEALIEISTAECINMEFMDSAKEVMTSIGLKTAPILHVHPSTLGITQEEYNDWFQRLIFDKIMKERTKLQAELDNL
jgi:CBS-domain-containing membrane protein